MTHTLKTDFYKKFNALSEAEKNILYIHTISFDMIYKTNLIKIARDLRIVDAEQRFLSDNKLKFILNKLVRSKLLISKHGYSINYLYSEFAMSEAFENVNIKPILDTIKTYGGGWGYSYSFTTLCRELRSSFYEQDTEYFIDSYAKIRNIQLEEWNRLNLFLKILNTKSGKYLIFNSSLEIIQTILTDIAESFFFNNSNIDFLYDFFEEGITKSKHYHLFETIYFDILILRDPTKVAKIIEKSNNPYYVTPFYASSLLFSGQPEKALLMFEESLTTFRKTTGKRNSYPLKFYTFFNLIVLFADDNPKNLTKIEKHLKYIIKNNLNFLSIPKTFEPMLLFRKGQIEKAKEKIYSIENSYLNYENEMTILEFYFFMLTIHWCFPNMISIHSDDLTKFKDNAIKKRFYQIAIEFDILLSAIKSKKPFEEIIETIENKYKLKSILPLIKKKELWRNSLDALLALNTSKKEVKNKRIIWLINIKEYTIEPKEQVLNKKGWSSGRAIALKRLYFNKVSSMSEEDRKVTKAMYEEKDYYSSNFYGFNFEKAILALCGHPFIFSQKSPDLSIELICEEMKLEVIKKGDFFNIKFPIEFDLEDKAIMQKENERRYKIFPIKENHKKIKELLGETNLKIPVSEEKSIQKVIDNISSIIPIQSNIATDSLEIPQIKPDKKLRVLLSETSFGFQVEIIVRPFGKKGPYFTPTKGHESLIVNIDNKKVQTIRDLKKENRDMKFIIENSKILTKLNSGNNLWEIEDIADCLDLLVELKDMSSKVKVEWLKTEKFKISGLVNYKNLSVKINKKNDWFELSGNVKINDKEVLEIKNLLPKLKKTNGNFIELEDGSFLALEKKLLQKLKSLEKWSDSTKDGLKFHPLSAIPISEIVENANKKEFDKSWKNLKTATEKAFSTIEKIPSTFQAEFRNYQYDGYQWLHRITKIGAGACLADDMGLGKTIQALGFMLTKASKGPSLVIAPTSVCYNWINEIKKFTPTMTGYLLDEKDRKAQIKKMKPFHILICSYGLLVNEIDILKTIEWESVIFDEAQSLKNPEAKRAKAAAKINSPCKIMTTGTPIENNLSELWSLFNIINPGLLGNIKSFNTKYAIPIERDNCLETKNHLKNLVKPFILRRLKSNVLDELPPKTEITVSVPMSKEESAFYEALRRKAIERLEDNDNKNHIEILAEIMKLRRASCNPLLVAPNCNISSSKLIEFERIIDEILENNHKVLVFSQFVGHLKILEDKLKEKSISYQYLDGSTPMKKRPKKIDGFQNGEGDVFLISLKAGGSGLNLTAADYVIHMDPWWNPAVEDQASDRAHRIGQKNPVTIYRIIMEGSIEEKILKLHQRKRALADSLLEGTETSSKLSAKELFDLIAKV